MKTPQKNDDVDEPLDADFSDDIDSLGGMDIKINPDYYIHSALLRAQKCLLKDNLKDGFLAYVVYIEHIETLADAANMLEDDYRVKLDEFRKKLKDVKDPLANDIKMSNEKLRLMMSAVFNRKEIKAPLKTA